MDLTYKQRLFVSYYTGVSAGNAVDAARRAGYAWPDKQGSQLLGKTRIRAAVEAKATSAAMAADEVLARLSDIAGADPLDFVDLRPKAKVLVSLATLRRLKRHGMGHVIKRIKMKGDDIEIELEPKHPAFDKLGQFLGLWDRDRPVGLSFVDLAQKLRERLQGDRDRGDRDPGGLPGGDPG
jgi:hypothetical protein